MPVTDAGWRAWNTPNEDAELLATDCNGQGRDVIMLSPQVFARRMKKEWTLKLEPGHCLQQVMDDELGRERLFDEV